MKRSRDGFGHGRRAAALVAWMALTAAGVADSSGNHACPHHDELPASAASADAAGLAHRSSARPVEHRASPGAEAHGAGHGHEDGPCTCVGGVCSAVPPALPGAHRTPAVATNPAAQRQGIGAQEGPRAARQEYLLPYSTAPPTV